MRRLFYLIVTIGFVVILLRLVDVKIALGYLAQARWSLVALGVTIGFIHSLAVAFRLRLLLSVQGRFSLGRLWALGYVGALISLIFPFSAGGLAMAYFIAQRLKVPYKKILLVMLVDFFLGVGWVAALAAAALPYFAHKRLLVIYQGETALVWGGLLGVIGLLILTFLKVSRFRSKVWQQLSKGIEIIARSKRILGKAVALTILAGCLGLIEFYLFFLAFNLTPKPVDFALASGLLGVLNFIPGALAKIGQYEILGVLTLPYLLNLDKNAVLAVLVVQHLLSVMTICVVGSFSWYKLKLDIDLVKKWQKRNK